MMKGSIEKLRVEYGNVPLLEETLLADPMQQFLLWFKEALKAKVMEPNGMTLATVTSAGHPTSRTVLLKEASPRGFTFFTQLTSRKGEHLKFHPVASLTFWWKEIYRQISVEGRVIQVSRREVVDYFAKRPRGAQLAAHTSSQSAPLASRQELDVTFRQLQKKYRGRKVPCPKDWGGYRLQPNRIEFWQGRRNRLHDRFVYVKANGEWVITRLSP